MSGESRSCGLALTAGSGQSKHTDTKHAVGFISIYIFYCAVCSLFHSSVHIIFLIFIRFIFMRMNGRRSPLYRVSPRTARATGGSPPQQGPPQRQWAPNFENRAAGL